MLQRIKLFVHTFLGLVIIYPVLACALDLHRNPLAEFSEDLAGSTHHACHGDAQPTDSSRQDLMCCDQGILPDHLTLPKGKDKFVGFGLFYVESLKGESRLEAALNRENLTYEGPSLNLFNILDHSSISPNAPPDHSI
jgi:hypothetical protein